MILILGMVLIGTIVYVGVTHKVIPSTIFCVEWFAFIVIGIAFYYNKISGYNGLVYILMCCLAYAFFEKIGYDSLVVKIKKRKSCQYNFNVQNAELLFTCGIIVDVLLFVYTAWNRGYSFKSIASVLAVSSITRGMESEGALLAKIGNIFALSVMGVEGYVTAYSQCNHIKRKSKFFYLFIGITLSGMLSTGKSIVIWSLLIWISGWLTSANVHSFKYSEVWNYIRRNIKKLIIVGVFFLGLMGLMMYMRNQRNVGRILESLLLYTFGHIPVFSEWYSEIKYYTLQYSMGRQTLYGVFSRTPWNEGIVANFALLSGDGVKSNIFTAFRSIIEDFGKTGSIIFWSIFGMVTGNCRRRIELDKSSCWAITLLMSTYFFIFMSFIISAWHYYATMLAFALIWLELIFIGKFHLHSKRK